MNRFAQLVPGLLGAALSAILIAGCSQPPGTIVNQNESAQTAGQSAAGESTRNQGMPAISTADPALPVQDGAPDAPISSDGTVGNPGEAPGAPVAIDSGAGMAGAEGGAGGQSDVTGFESYRSDACGFTIGYPVGGESGYVVQDSPATQGTQAVCRIVFQTKHLAESDTAALQPPQFLIEVFDAPAAQDLAAWLSAQGMPATSTATWTVEPLKVGGVDGLKVSNMQMLAPNEFVYVLKGTLVYKLTPLGRYSQQMLDSFAFTS